MEWIIGLIILVVVVGLFAYGYYRYLQNRASRPRIERFSRNPEIICRSNSCSVEVQWEVTASGDELNVSVQLRGPGSRVVPLSSSTEGSVQLGASDESLFPETSVYFVELEATVGDGDSQIESLRVAFHAEDKFTLEEAWSTGFVGGLVSENETVATHSFVLSQQPFVGFIEEIDSKVPTSASVCAKSMALLKVVYQSGTIVAGAVRPVEVTVRRPGSSEIASGTLQHGDELVLPQEALVDDGLEILSVMRSETGSSIVGSQWALGYELRCIE